MKFKKRFFTLFTFLLLSFVVPQQPIVSTPDTIQTVTVVQAKKKVTKKTTKKSTKKSAKKKSVNKSKKTGTKAKKEAQVYVTPTGECYHTHACGRGNYYKASLSTAKSRGLRPCQKCY